MISYHLTNTFSVPELLLLRLATNAVELMPDPKGKQKIWRCHEVARAVRNLLGTGRVIDGHYGKCDHTWIELHRKDDVYVPVILDVYAAGRVPQVQLVDMFWGLPHKKAYTVGEPRKDIRRSVVDYLVKSVQANPKWKKLKQRYEG